jgi:hypothetical protein
MASRLVFEAAVGGFGTGDTEDFAGAVVVGERRRRG